MKFTFFHCISLKVYSTVLLNVKVPYIEKNIRQKKEREALELVSCVIAHYTYPAFFRGLFPTSFLSHMTAPLGICAY